MNKIVWTLGLGTFLFSAALLFSFQVQNKAYAASGEREQASVRIGDFQVLALSDGVNKRAVGQQAQMLQGDAAKNMADLERAYPSGELETTVNAFLLIKGKNLTLIDTGNGSNANPPMGRVLDNLRAAGYEPEQIGAVYLTHMHPDHIGGLSSGQEAVFKNATVYADQREAGYWLDDEAASQAPESLQRTFRTAKAMLEPYIRAGKFKVFAPDEQLAPGVLVRELQGHTPGHVAYLIESKGAALAVFGDIIHVAAVQFADPSVTIAYDLDKAEAAKARIEIFKEAEAKGWFIAGAHLAFPGIGKLKNDGKGGYEFVPLSDKSAK